MRNRRSQEMTVTRRTEFGPFQASFSRYSTFSLLAGLATFGLLVELSLESSATRGASHQASALVLEALCAFMVLSMPISYTRGMAHGERTREVRETSAKLLVTYQSQPEEHIVDYLYPRPETVKYGAQVLERLDYDVFSSDRELDRGREDHGNFHREGGIARTIG